MSTNGSTKAELKLAVVGSGGVGKTAMTIRFVTSHFYDQGYNPTIEDSYRKQVVVNGEAVTLEIVDTAGQEEYAAMADQWYRYAQGFLLVYSITDRQSYFNIRKLHTDILRAKEVDVGGLPAIIVCNKCDLSDDRAVGQLEARDLAREFHAPFIECSAADGINVDVAFRELVKRVRREHRREGRNKRDDKHAGSGPSIDKDQVRDQVVRNAIPRGAREAREANVQPIPSSTPGGRSRSRADSTRAAGTASDESHARRAETPKSRRPPHTQDVERANPYKDGGDADYRRARVAAWPWCCCNVM